MSGGEREVGTTVLRPELPIAMPPSREEHNRAIFTGVVWQGSLRWLAQVLSWTATLVIARRLSPEDYGIAGTASVLVALMSLASETGLGRALVLRRERDDAVIRQSHATSIVIGAVMAAAMLAIAVPGARFYAEPKLAPVIAVLAGSLIVSGANAVPLAMLQQQLRYRELAAVEFSKAFVQALTVLLGALAGLRYWSLIDGIIAGQIAAFALTRRYIRVSVEAPSRAVLGPTLTYSRFLILGSIAWALYTNADFAVVGRVVGIAALGYYQFAWNIAQLPGEKLANIFQAVVGPFFGAIGSDKIALKHYFILLSELLVSVMLPVLCGFALVSPMAVPLLFGARWTPAVPLMQILVACAALGSFSQLTQHVLGATGQAAVNARVNAVALAVMPVAFYFSARFAGTFAVALVWLVAQPFLLGVPLFRAIRTIELPVGEYLRSLKAPIVASTGMVVLVLATSFLLQRSPAIQQLVVEIFAGVASYCAIYLVFFRDRIAAIVALRRRAIESPAAS